MQEVEVPPSEPMVQLVVLVDKVELLSHYQTDSLKDN